MDDIEKRLLLLEMSLNNLLDLFEKNASLLKDVPVELARIMEQLHTLSEEVKQQREKLHVLENKPAKHWDMLVAAAVSALVTAIISGLIAGNIK